MTCPDCQGKGTIQGYGCPGFKLITMDCPLCKGAKEISVAQAKWVEHGEKIREAMKALRRTTREEAARRGIKAADWSAMMYGRAYNLDQEIPR